jgi:HTH-type transcriptional regulator/antitoxin MqsA
MQCGSSESMIHFEDETFIVGHAETSVHLDGLSGWQCSDCAEIEFDADGARRYAAMGDELVLRARQPRE